MVGEAEGGSRKRKSGFGAVNGRDMGIYKERYVPDIYQNSDFVLRCELPIE
jgi:hypothetical protein